MRVLFIDLVSLRDPIFFVYLLLYLILIYCLYFISSLFSIHTGATRAGWPVVIVDGSEEVVVLLMIAVAGTVVAEEGIDGQHEGISKHLGDDGAGDAGAVGGQGRIGVDFNQPHLHLLVDEKVEAEDFIVDFIGIVVVCLSLAIIAALLILLLEGVTGCNQQIPADILEGLAQLLKAVHLPILEPLLELGP